MSKIKKDVLSVSEEVAEKDVDVGDATSGCEEEILDVADNLFLSGHQRLCELEADMERAKFKRKLHAIKNEKLSLSTAIRDAGLMLRSLAAGEDLRRELRHFVYKYGQEKVTECFAEATVRALRAIEVFTPEVLGLRMLQKKRIQLTDFWIVVLRKEGFLSKLWFDYNKAGLQARAFLETKDTSDRWKETHVGLE